MSSARKGDIVIGTVSKLAGPLSIQKISRILLEQCCLDLTSSE